MTTAIPLGWKFKRRIWARWQALRFRLSRPQDIGAPARRNSWIDVVPLETAHPSIPISNVQVYERLPRDEAHLGMRVLVRAGLLLNRLVPQMRAGLPEIPDDADEALAGALTSPYRAAFRAPVRPAAFGGDGPALGDLAVEGPYALLLERDDEAGLQWDLRRLGTYEHHAGLRSLGVRVGFTDLRRDGRLDAGVVESDEYGTVRPGEPDWDASRRLAVCAATTHTALIRHFCHVHLISGNHWDVATRNHLPIDHPLYRLLWPHIFNSCYTNHGVTRPQLLPDGDFVNMFSLTHEGLATYYDEMYAAYDIRMIEPMADHERRGLADDAFPQPGRDNLRELFTVMHDHASRYVDAHYADDDQLRADAAVEEWLAQLDELVPNGLDGLLPRPLTRAGLARLIGAYIFEGNTIHDLVGTTLWDYQLWPDMNPTRIRRDGRRVPVDVFQRTINNNFALQLRRAPLLADYGAVALDARGAALFTQFFEECTALQQRYDATPAGPWRMEPENLELNMNG